MADDLTVDIAGQTRQVLARIDAILDEAGASKADIASVQVWLSDIADFGGTNALWDAWVDHDNPPARATGGVRPVCDAILTKVIVIARVPGIA